MTIEDIYSTLVHQNMITAVAATSTPVRPSPGQSIKFPRGRRNGVARRHLQRSATQKESDGGGNKPNAPLVPPARYEISWDQENVGHWLESWEKKGYLKLKAEKLKWTPFVLSRTKGGGEVLQAGASFGAGAVSAVAQTETPGTLLDGGAPINDRATLSATGLAASGTERGEEEVAEVLHDVSEMPAARLFDDLLVDTVTTPKKQLRSGLKEGTTPHSLAHSSRQKVDLVQLATLRETRPASSRPVVDGDSEARVGNTYPVPDAPVSDIREADLTTPTVPIKRRRGRPPRVRPPDVIPALAPPQETRSRTPLPPKPASPRKRRRVSSPIPQDCRTPTNLEDSARRDEDVQSPTNHHQQLANGQNHTTNGLRHDLSISPRLPSAILASEDNPAVGTAGQEKESEHENRLRDGDLMGLEHPDVKSEDLGTPLTGLTSFHSVPSDDTVFMSDGLNGAVIRSKISWEVEGVSPGSPGRHKVDGDLATGGPTMDIPAVDDSDLDAEGEPDDDI
jgi:hypothetical protein